MNSRVTAFVSRGAVTALAVMLLLCLCVGVGAGQADDGWIVEFIGDETTSAQGTVETSHEVPIFQVLFMAPDGEVFFASWIVQGEGVHAPEGAPPLTGSTFLHWYEAGQTGDAPFSFGQAVARDLVLLPAYRSDSVQQDGHAEYQEQDRVEVVYLPGTDIIVTNPVRDEQSILETVLQDQPAIVQDILSAGEQVEPPQEAHRETQMKQQEAYLAEILDSFNEELEEEDDESLTQLPEQPEEADAQNDTTTTEQGSGPVPQDAFLVEILGEPEDTTAPMEIVEQVETGDKQDEGFEVEIVEETSDETQQTSEAEPGAQTEAVAAEDAQAEDAGTIVISTSVTGGSVRDGDVIHLTGELIGFAETPQVSWQYNAGDGWIDTGVQTLHHSFVLDEDNYYWVWRLVTKAAE